MFYLYQAVKNLFKHRHKWETTHTNRYGSSTRKVCGCGCIAVIEGFETGRFLSDWWWCCSDGSVWPVEGWGLLNASQTKQSALDFAKTMAIKL